MWQGLSQALIGPFMRRWKAGVLVAVAVIAAVFVLQVLAADDEIPGHSAGGLRAHPHTIEVSFPQIDAWKYDLPGVTQVEERIRAEALLLVQELSTIGNVWGTHDVHVDEDDLLSVTMLYSAYHEPMAHPMHLRKSVTANLRTGEIYTLADLFDDVDYVGVLSWFVAQQIEEDDASTLVDFKTIASDQDFYLTEDALVLYFQLYELYPYAWGFPEFAIPYSEIRSIIKEGGPISELLDR